MSPGTGTDAVVLIGADASADQMAPAMEIGSQLLTAPPTKRHRYKQLSRSGRSPTQSERHGENAISEQDHGTVTDIDGEDRLWHESCRQLDDARTRRYRGLSARGRQHG